MPEIKSLHEAKKAYREERNAKKLQELDFIAAMSLPAQDRYAKIGIELSHGRWHRLEGWSYDVYATIRRVLVSGSKNKFEFSTGVRTGLYGTFLTDALVALHEKMPHEPATVADWDLIGEACDTESTWCKEYFIQELLERRGL